MKNGISRICAGISCFSVILFAAGCGSSGTASLRVVQASPDLGQVNVLVNGTTVSSDIGYAGNTGYLSVNAGSPSLEVEPVNTSTAVVNETLNLGSTTESTVIVANYAANVEGLVLTDNNTDPPSGDIQLRVVNASPGIGSADVYFVPSGSSLATIAPIITSLGFESASAYETLTAGTYQVFLTAPGTKNAYFSTGQLTLTAGQIRTIVALNSTTGGYTSITLADLN
jgi:Domain of unknown function (DUF4397)